MFIIQQKHTLNALITSNGVHHNWMPTKLFQVYPSTGSFRTISPNPKCYSKKLLLSQKHITHNQGFIHSYGIQVNFSNSMFTIMHCGPTLNQDQYAFNITSHPQGYFIHLLINDSKIYLEYHPAYGKPNKGIWQWISFTIK